MSACCALRGACVLIACGFAAACSARDSVDDALLAAQPHIDTFARFERWVDQARGAELAPTRAGALAEAIFSPLRAEPSVLAAFVRDDLHGRARVLALPEQAVLPADASWIAIRNRELGTLRVASFDACPLPARRGSEQPIGCVILEKQRAAADGGKLSVSVVFRSGEKP